MFKSSNESPWHDRYVVNRRLALAALPPLCLAPAVCAAQALKDRVMRFTFSRALTDRRTQWLIAVHREVLRRLGLGFEFVDAPPGRGTLMVLAGEADGELGRTYHYAELHPRLLRLTEPNNVVEFAAYGIVDRQDPRTWSRSFQQGLRCEYRRGIYELQRLLEQQLVPDQVSAIATVAQGLRRLQLGRTDLYFDVREAVADFLRYEHSSHDWISGLNLSEPAVVLRTTGHVYLGPAHADLVGPMSDTLRQMKADGLVNRMLHQALDRS